MRGQPSSTVVERSSKLRSDSGPARGRVPHPSRSLRRVGFDDADTLGILNSYNFPQPSCDI